ncbi:autotransporter-associated beta strand repeat-containing protein [Luteolibacter yonseiensis]|uniref:Autotransporter-associated beta strand repeat-containing protein n=1 Tax=Luteolibacter yonseiensis TaxID=1144680 RepID=A0A934R136_9BACT|nr:autotransporter-associated beta strand repeat-containing protein [Luteolibacter yonseiensis]MBK1814814.1 autotransporter-associated beta strand repeat-containing protein [Luteolibacter yonseiensis]
MKSKPNLFGRAARFPLAASSAAVSICFGGAAFATVWDGTGTVVTEWNDNGNWVGDIGTTGSAATINISSPVATISSNITTQPADILIGAGASTNGRLDQTAGTAQTGSGNWMKIGHNGGTGVFNLANTAATGGTLTGFGQGSGSMNVRGELRIGGGDGGSGGNGRVNVHTTGTLSSTSALHVGTNTSTGVLNIDSGTVAPNGTVNIGNGAAGAGGVTGTLNMSGGAFTKTGANNFIVGDAGGNGFVNLNGGTITSNNNFAAAQAGGKATVTVNGGTISNNGEFWVGTGAGSIGTATLKSGVINTNSWFCVGRQTGTGTLNVEGGTINKTNNGGAFIVGDGANGTLNQTNGTISVNGAEFWVGSGAGASGTYAMSGGTLNLGNWVVIGRNGGAASFTQTGGTINKSGTGDFILAAGGGNGGSTADYTFKGGLVDVTGGVTHIGKEANNTAVLTMKETAVFRTSQMVVGFSGSTGTVNLSGGTLETPSLIGGSGTSTAHFDGTTLRATASTDSLVSGISTADIVTGGALIDTQGFTATASQVFGGGGTLTKLGSGTLNLTGDSTHTGPTQVTDGKLVVTTRNTEAGAFTVANGKTLGVTRRSAGQSLNVSNLTLGTSASATTLEMNLGSFGNPGSATLNVVGNLAVNGTTTINISNGYPEVGSLPLIQFGSKSGTGTFVLGSLPPGVVAELDTTTDPNIVYLVIDQAKLLEWDDSELTGGVWNTANTNWNDVLTGAPAPFTTGAPVAFLDRGLVDFENPPNPDVVIAAEGVSPGLVTFNNDVISYSITGAGGINGTASVLKQGPGTVTISTPNAYTGVTRIEAGTLSVGGIANAGSPSGIGASPVNPANLVLAGGKLSYTGPAATTDRGFTIAASNSAIEVANSLTVGGTVTATAGLWAKTGAGTLRLTNPGANILAGGLSPGVRVEQGSLVLSGGGTQTNSVTGDVWVGTVLTSGADLVLDHTTLNSTGYLALARGNGTEGHVSTATFTSSTVATANLSLGYNNGLAEYVGTSVLTLNDSSYTTGFSKIGESSGATATVTLNGASSMVSDNTDVAQNTGSTGTLNIKGTSTYRSNNRLWIAPSVGTTGSVSLENSGSLTVLADADVGRGGSGSLSLKDNASFSTTGSLYVGRDVTQQGTVTQTGGTVTGGGNEFQIGKSGTGTWLQSGGVTNAGGWVAIARETAGVGVLTVSGTGTFNQTGADRAIVVGENGNGTLNIQGTGTVSSVGSGGIILSRGGATAAVNLDGGTLVALKISDAGGTSSFSFNGGLLKAGTGAAAEFMTGIDTVTVKAGGAKIDTNGNSITIAQQLLDGETGGGLVKSGAGVLTLTGSNTYAGATLVNAGKLVVDANYYGQGNFTVADGAALGVNLVSPGTQLSVNHLTLGTSASSTLDISLVSDAPDPAFAPVNVAGNLTVNGTVTINVTNPAPVLGQFPLIKYDGSKVGTGTFVLGTLPAGLGAMLVVNNGNKSIDLQINTLPGTPYGSFEASNGIAGAGAGADSDQDGIKNGIEFVIGGDPSGPGSDSSALLPTSKVNGAYLDFVYRRTSVSASSNPYVEYGSDLTGWTTAVAGTNGVVINVEANGFGTGVDKVTVRIPQSLATNSKLFAKLGIRIP